MMKVLLLHQHMMKAWELKRMKVLLKVLLNQGIPGELSQEAGVDSLGN